MRWLRRLFGYYDTISCVDLTGDSRRAHLQLWHCVGHRYREGDEVPHLPNGRSTYSISTGEGWCVNIAQGRVRGWSDKPIHDTVVDARGRQMRTAQRVISWH